MVNKESKIYVAGHRGMVGTAIINKLNKSGYNRLPLRTSSQLDLRNQQAVDTFIKNEKPDVIIIAAARVGGIMANNSYPYQFIYDNLAIETNLINSAHKHDVSKVIFLGSSCIYPKLANQPLKEEYLLTGPLEPTNEWYAIAKITGIKLCEALRKQYNRNYVSLMPTNLYGPNDNFDLETSHVLPAMIRKFHDAKVNGHETVTLWGTGKPMREFLYVEDMADAVLYAMEHELNENLYNIGTGKDITIRELAELIQNVIGHKGNIRWNTDKPDGTPRKLLDISKMKNEGWTYKTALTKGIRNTYSWFLEHHNQLKEVKIV
ncbi:MAG TPA: GDP-L-fucose synthase [Bacteroidales bacterium]|nr:GDP-L-fucose synthase [Bacteroidales bacterium]